jgi:hypothetical protein
LVDFLKFISEQFSASQAAFGTILSEGFIELVKDFKKRAETLHLLFSPQNRNQKIRNHH